MMPLEMGLVAASEVVAVVEKAATVAMTVGMEQQVEMTAGWTVVVRVSAAAHRRGSQRD